MVAILALAGVVLTLLFSLLQAMPAIPNDFLQTVLTILPYINMGIKFLNSFMYVDVVYPLAVACIAVHAFYTEYRVVMWVLKKIPMFAVSD